MKLIHENKVYKLLLATNKYRYYIYQDELILVDVKNGYERFRKARLNRKY